MVAVLREGYVLTEKDDRSHLRKTVHKVLYRIIEVVQMLTSFQTKKINSSSIVIEYKNKSTQIRKIQWKIRSFFCQIWFFDYT